MPVQGLATGGLGEAMRFLEAFWHRVTTASGSPDMAGAGVLLPFAEVMAARADALLQAVGGLSRGRIKCLG